MNHLVTIAISTFLGASLSITWMNYVQPLMLDQTQESDTQAKNPKNPKTFAADLWAPDSKNISKLSPKKPPLNKNMTLYADDSGKVPSIVINNPSGKVKAFKGIIGLDMTFETALYANRTKLFDDKGVYVGPIISQDKVKHPPSAPPKHSHDYAKPNHGHDYAVSSHSHGQYLEKSKLHYETFDFSANSAICYYTTYWNKDFSVGCREGEVISGGCEIFEKSPHIYIKGSRLYKNNDINGYLYHCVAFSKDKGDCERVTAKISLLCK